MVIFSKNMELSLTQKDTLVFDFLYKLGTNIDHYQALYLRISKLQNQNLRMSQRQALIETFENAVKKTKGEIFTLDNEDMVVIFGESVYDEIQACLIKIRFLFHDDPNVRNAADLLQSGFAEIFNLQTQVDDFKALVKKVKDQENMVGGQPRLVPNVRPNVAANVLANRKTKRELTPTILSKMQKALSMMDFSSLIRRQSVCAVIGKSAPQMIFDEVFVSIADLRDMLMPDVDLFSNPWLFMYLTETLDKRVLASLSRHDDGALTSNFSLNMNVSTILSDDFLEFDENINPVQRSTIVLEFQLIDIFSDIKAFILAKTFAQYRGYKICIDGITVDKLQYIDREHLQSDLIKIIWHPSFMDIIHEDKHFTDYVNKSERARMILCRVDDPQAVEIGNSLGINLYQGRYIQRLLAAQPRKTIFSIKK